MKRTYLVALAACLIAAGCASASASRSPTPSPTDQATLLPTPTATSAPTPSPTPEPTPSPTTTAVPTPTAFPTGVPGALDLVQAYENALVGRHYDKAWSMLGPAYQALLGSQTAYTEERTEFMNSAGRGYTVVANPTDIVPLAAWLKGQPFASSIDKAHAVLVKVTWTSLSANNAGLEVWVVNPIAGGWELYGVR